MIRFINIGDQITQFASDFAFWDTVVDKFVTLCDETVFHSVQHLIQCDRNHCLDAEAGKRDKPRHDIGRLVAFARGAKMPEKDPLDG